MSWHVAHQRQHRKILRCCGIWHFQLSYVAEASSSPYYFLTNIKCLQYIDSISHITNSFDFFPKITNPIHFDKSNHLQMSK